MLSRVDQQVVSMVALLGNYASYVSDIFTFLQNILLAYLCMSVAVLLIFS